MDYPALTKDSINEYGSLDGLPEEIQKFLTDYQDKLTIDQLRQYSDFIYKKIDEFKNKLDSSITMEQFEKVKKQDADNDYEEKE